ncbi:transmembrane protein, putative (macronuclear) [Tetrahymena thermophila SB210]|uniref:Transmembrane protein, putative n=1 Tax=Tetrahymena thermophila (strain SB210) TaxID=312017 RepID=W7XE96_TETTS|nr:transmembrane protein, putative [Tetrahymena thermophila SB210]EWS74888.1 transmembrane protein, putative [Tetrahymena thermophila SB210]|eukprot:XP_012652601.1 transmembrane protein, putative [Tetrahymena thermophila SB210]
MSILGSNLAKCSNLSYFYLYLQNQVSIGSDVMKYLGHEIAKYPKLKELYLDLSQNNFEENQQQNHDSGDQLNNSLKNLTILLNQNNIMKNIAQSLDFSFKQFTDLLSLKIELKSNQIEDEFFIQLTSQLATQTKLQTLILSLERNNIKASLSQNLGNGLANLKCLSTLDINLSENGLGGNDIFGQLQLAKLTNLTNLKLNLMHNNIGENGTKALATYDNNIQDSAFELAQSLTNCSNLSNLTLWLGDNDVEKNMNKLYQLYALIQKIVHSLNFLCFNIMIDIIMIVCILVYKLILVWQTVCQKQKNQQNMIFILNDLV